MVRLARSGRLGDEWRDIVHPKEMNLLCESCVEGKGVKLPSPPSRKRAKKANGICHFDIWGPARVKSVGGSVYMMSCYDDNTHRIQLYFLKKKSHALSAFKKYLALVRNQCSTRVKLVRTDNGGEFTSKKFLEVLENEGIIANPIPPNSHQQNGRIERVHLTVMNLVRTMLIDSGLPRPFWSEAANYAAFVRNRVPKRGTTDLPQELWTGEKCSLTQLRPFGSTVFVRDHTEPDRLSPRWFKALLMGFKSYSEHTVRYYDPVTKRFNYSRDYKFIRATQASPPPIFSSSIPKDESLPVQPPADPLPAAVSRPLSPASKRFDSTLETIAEEVEESEIVADTRPVSVCPQADSGPALPGRVASRKEGDLPEPVDAGRHLSLAPTVSRAIGSASRNLPETVPVRTLDSTRFQATVEDVPEPPIRPKPKESKFVSVETTTKERGKDLFMANPAPPSFIDDAGKRRTSRIPKPTKHFDDDQAVIAVLEIEHPGGSDATGTYASTEPLANLLGLLDLHKDAMVCFSLLATDCPTTFNGARSSPDWPEWLKAILDEIAKLQKYDVYQIVERTKDMRVLRARWVFTRKIDPETGEAAAFRARWVAKGYTEIEGLDFQEIFASVAHKDTIRIFLALVNWAKLHCDQVDIIAAFLNGVLKEELFLEPPEGLDIAPGKVLKLNKSLYGLRQSPRCFNDKLDSWLRSQDFVPATADPCLYVYQEGKVFMMLTVHVDDQLIASNDRSALDKFKADLNAAFECKDHGPVNYFLGVSITRDVEKRKLSMSQDHYFTHLLERFDMADCKPAKTPLPSDFTARVVSDEDFEQAKHLPYREIVGSVMYAATITRPDLAYSAGLLARFMSKWSTEHYRAAKHMLRYIKGTMEYALTFDAGSSKRTLQGYVDADWVAV
jgi:hypothetical protein